MTAAGVIFRDGYGFDCPVCLDFGTLAGLGPCPTCRPDAYAEYCAALVEAGVVG